VLTASAALVPELLTREIRLAISLFETPQQSLTQVIAVSDSSDVKPIVHGERNRDATLTRQSGKTARNETKLEQDIKWSLEE